MMVAVDGLRKASVVLQALITQGVACCAMVGRREPHWQA